MYKMVNGTPVQMTTEEIAKYEQERDERLASQPEPPSPEERMANLETDVKQMKSEMDDLGYILTGEVLSNAQ